MPRASDLPNREGSVRHVPHVMPLRSARLQPPTTAEIRDTPPLRARSGRRSGRQHPRDPLRLRTAGDGGRTPTTRGYRNERSSRLSIRLFVLHWPRVRRVQLTRDAFGGAPWSEPPFAPLPNDPRRLLFARLFEPRQSARPRCAVQRRAWPGSRAPCATPCCGLALECSRDGA
jgi:hypothetical protein